MSMNVTIRDLLEAGVHFGHQSARWNPKMKRFIFEERNKIHIIDLQKTMECLTKAYDYIKGITSRGHKVLFVGTKKQAKDLVREAVERCGMYYVNERWLGGLLTNFVTIRKSVGRYKEIQQMMDDGTINKIPGKEASSMRREWTKLHRNLEGIKDMEEIPTAIFIVDPQREAIAVKEATRTGVTVVAIADTNCDPDLLEYPIPGNDDAVRTIKLICDVIADAVLEGKKHMAVSVMSAPATAKLETPEAEAKHPHHVKSAARPKKSVKPEGKEAAEEKGAAHSEHKKKEESAPKEGHGHTAHKPADKMPAPKKKEIKKPVEAAAGASPEKKE